MNPITHLRRNAVAYLALFAALGTGTAYAAGKITSAQIAPNAVKAKHIKDGQVRGAELAGDAVTGAKVAANSLTGADIDESTLVGVAGGAAASAAPGPDSVGSAEVKDDSLTGKDIDESTLGGLPKLIAAGYISGVGPLNSGDRCNSVVTTAPGVGFGDTVIITPPTMPEEVVFTGKTGDESVTYQACYTGSASVSLNGDVRFMVLRAP